MAGSLFNKSLFNNIYFKGDNLGSLTPNYTLYFYFVYWQHLHCPCNVFDIPIVFFYWIVYPTILINILHTCKHKTLFFTLRIYSAIKYSCFHFKILRNKYSYFLNYFIQQRLWTRSIISWTRIIAVWTYSTGSWTRTALIMDQDSGPIFSILAFWYNR